MLAFMTQDLVGAVLDASPAAIASLRMIAAIVLVTMLCGLIYLLRNLRDLKAEAGPRAQTTRSRANHIMIFVACAVVFGAACVLLFLVAKP